MVKYSDLSRAVNVLVAPRSILNPFPSSTQTQMKMEKSEKREEKADGKNRNR